MDMKCSALVRGTLAMKDWKEEFEGKTIKKPVGLPTVAGGFYYRCTSLLASHQVERDGLVFQVCGNHTRATACLIADFGQEKKTTIAQVGNVFIDTTTYEEVEQLTLFDEKEGLFVLAFTGHRPQKLGGYEPNPIQSKVISRLEGNISANVEKQTALGKQVVLVTGGALGVDQWAAEAGMRMGVPFVVAAPFFDQAKMWPTSSKRVYENICMHADVALARHLMGLIHTDRYRQAAYDQYTNRIIVSDGEYAGWKMQRRNEFMVDLADGLIAVWDGTAGGTANCVRYASKINTPIRRINPGSL
jgi:uncharacterized phage-like protein YoqJ